MENISYLLADSDHDFEGILALQKQNHVSSLASLDQGFVTVVHSIEELKKMNGYAQHVIAKDGEKVIAYLLAMTLACKDDVPLLLPMFDQFEKIFYRNKKLSTYNYLVVGQVCVADGYRGKGILNHCYSLYKNTHSVNFDFAITEIATRNFTSIRAHQKIGFQEIKRFTDSLPEEWSIVVWDWMNEI